MEDSSRMQSSNLLGVLSKAITNMPSRKHLNLESISQSAPQLRKRIHEMLTRDQRIQAFDELINVNPNTPKNEYIDAVLFLGRFLLANQFLNECYIFLTVCQERTERVYGEPVDFTLYEELGNMFYLTGQCNDAIKWYEKLMEMNEAPESKMYFNIGMCYQVLSNYTQAIEAYLKSTTADSRFVKSWVNLGYCYLHVGNGDKAIQAFQQLPQQSSESLTCIGNAHFKMGNLEEAIAQYLRAVEIKEEPGTYNNLGCALKKVGLFQDAIYAFNDSLALQPNVEAASNLVTLYIELGKHSDAAVLLNSCTKLLPQAELRSLSRWIEEFKPSEKRISVSGKPGLHAAIRNTLMAKRTIKLDHKSPRIGSISNSNASSVSQIRSTTKVKL